MTKRTMGAYELEQPIARGWMSEIWRARDIARDRLAAVKLIDPETLTGPAWAKDAAIQHLLWEAELTASLASTHAVRVFDWGVGPDGSGYCAMELLEGMNAEHHVYRFGAVPAQRAVAWLRQACDVLGEMHDRGLVHCDIKPANLFVTETNRDHGRIKVIDYGLVRVMPGSETEPSSINDEHAGSAGYMAPEQIQGRRVDPRTDVYALGCVGYWLLAGRRPFEADEDKALQQMHVHAPPPTLTTSSDPIPPALVQLIEAMLSKDPNVRPSSARALRAALDSTFS